MQVATTIDGDGGMVVKRLSVPMGLEELMESLTKQVLMKKPQDVYTFASEHFAHLLLLRDASLGETETSPSPSRAPPKSHPKTRSTTVATKFNKLPTPVIFTNSKTSKPSTTPKMFASTGPKKHSRYSVDNSPRSLKSSSSETSLKNGGASPAKVGRAKWKKPDATKEKPPIVIDKRAIRENYKARKPISNIDVNKKKRTQSLDGKNGKVKPGLPRMASVEEDSISVSGSSMDLNAKNKKNAGARKVPEKAKDVIKKGGVAIAAAAAVAPLVVSKAKQKTAVKSVKEISKNSVQSEDFKTDDDSLKDISENILDSSKSVTAKESISDKEDPVKIEDDGQLDNHAQTEEDVLSEVTSAKISEDQKIEFAETSEDSTAKESNKSNDNEDPENSNVDGQLENHTQTKEEIANKVTGATISNGQKKELLEERDELKSAEDEVLTKTLQENLNTETSEKETTHPEDNNNNHEVPASGSNMSQLPIEEIMKDNVKTGATDTKDEVKMEDKHETTEDNKNIDMTDGTTVDEIKTEDKFDVNENNTNIELSKESKVTVEGKVSEDKNQSKTFKGGDESKDEVKKVVHENNMKMGEESEALKQSAEIGTKEGDEENDKYGATGLKDNTMVEGLGDKNADEASEAGFEQNDEESTDVGLGEESVENIVTNNNVEDQRHSEIKVEEHTTSKAQLKEEDNNRQDVTLDTEEAQEDREKPASKKYGLNPDKGEVEKKLEDDVIEDREATNPANTEDLEENNLNNMHQQKNIIEDITTLVNADEEHSSKRKKRDVSYVEDGNEREEDKGGEENRSRNLLGETLDTDSSKKQQEEAHNSNLEQSKDNVVDMHGPQASTESEDHKNGSENNGKANEQSDHSEENLVNIEEPINKVVSNDLQQFALVSNQSVEDELAKGEDKENGNGDINVEDKDRVKVLSEDESANNKTDDSVEVGPLNNDGNVEGEVNKESEVDLRVDKSVDKAKDGNELEGESAFDGTSEHKERDLEEAKNDELVKDVEDEVNKDLSVDKSVVEAKDAKEHEGDSASDQTSEKKKEVKNDQPLEDIKDEVNKELEEDLSVDSSVVQAEDAKELEGEPASEHKEYDSEEVKTEELKKDVEDEVNKESEENLSVAESAVEAIDRKELDGTSELKEHDFEEVKNDELVQDVEGEENLNGDKTVVEIKGGRELEDDPNLAEPIETTVDVKDGIDEQEQEKENDKNDGHSNTEDKSQQLEESSGASIEGGAQIEERKNLEVFSKNDNDAASTYNEGEKEKQSVVDSDTVQESKNAGNEDEEKADPEVEGTFGGIIKHNDDKVVEDKEEELQDLDQHLLLKDARGTVADMNKGTGSNLVEEDNETKPREDDADYQNGGLESDKNFGKIISSVVGEGMPNLQTDESLNEATEIGGVADVKGDEIVLRSHDQLMKNIEATAVDQREEVKGSLRREEKTDDKSMEDNVEADVQESNIEGPINQTEDKESEGNLNKAMENEHDDVVEHEQQEKIKNEDTDNIVEAVKQLGKVMSTDELAKSEADFVDKKEHKTDEDGSRGDEIKEIEEAPCVRTTINEQYNVNSDLKDDVQPMNANDGTAEISSDEFKQEIFDVANSKFDELMKNGLEDEENKGFDGEVATEDIRHSKNGENVQGLAESTLEDEVKNSVVLNNDVDVNGESTKKTDDEILNTVSDMNTKEDIQKMTEEQGMSEENKVLNTADEKKLAKSSDVIAKETDMRADLKEDHVNDIEVEHHENSVEKGDLEDKVEKNLSTATPPPSKMGENGDQKVDNFAVVDEDTMELVAADTSQNQQGLENLEITSAKHSTDEAIENSQDQKQANEQIHEVIGKKDIDENLVDEQIKNTLLAPINASADDLTSPNQETIMNPKDSNVKEIVDSEINKPLTRSKAIMNLDLLAKQSEVVPTVAIILQDSDGKEVPIQTEDILPRVPSAKSDVEDVGPLHLEELSQYLSQKDLKEGTDEEQQQTAAETKPSISPEDQVDNEAAKHVKDENHNVTERFDPQTSAATKIQSLWRGHRIRKLQIKKPTECEGNLSTAATKIQALARGFLVRNSLGKRSEAEGEDHEAKAKLLGNDDYILKSLEQLDKLKIPTEEPTMIGDESSKTPETFGTSSDKEESEQQPFNLLEESSSSQTVEPGKHLVNEGEDLHSFENQLHDQQTGEVKESEKCVISTHALEVTDDMTSTPNLQDSTIEHTNNSTVHDDEGTKEFVLKRTNSLEVGSWNMTSTPNLHDSTIEDTDNSFVLDDKETKEFVLKPTNDLEVTSKMTSATSLQESETDYAPVHDDEGTNVGEIERETDDEELPSESDELIKKIKMNLHSMKSLIENGFTEYTTKKQPKENMDVETHMEKLNQEVHQKEINDTVKFGSTEDKDETNTSISKGKDDIEESTSTASSEALEIDDLLVEDQNKHQSTTRNFDILIIDPNSPAIIYEECPTRPVTSDVEGAFVFHAPGKDCFPNVEASKETTGEDIVNKTKLRSDAIQKENLEQEAPSRKAENIVVAEDDEEENGVEEAILKNNGERVGETDPKAVELDLDPTTDLNISDFTQSDPSSDEKLLIKTFFHNNNNNNEEDVKFLANLVNSVTKIQSLYRGYRTRTRRKKQKKTVSIGGVEEIPTTDPEKLENIAKYEVINDVIAKLEAEQNEELEKIIKAKPLELETVERNDQGECSSENEEVRAEASIILKDEDLRTSGNLNGTKAEVDEEKISTSSPHEDVDLSLQVPRSKRSTEANAIISNEDDIEATTMLDVECESGTKIKDGKEVSNSLEETSTTSHQASKTSSVDLDQATKESPILIESNSSEVTDVETPVEKVNESPKSIVDGIHEAISSKDSLNVHAVDGDSSMSISETNPDEDLKFAESADDVIEEESSAEGLKTTLESNSPFTNLIETKPELEQSPKHREIEDSIYRRYNAAKTIQSFFRNVAVKKDRDRASKIIQSCFRGYMTRRALKKEKQIVTYSMDEVAAALKIQQKLREYMNKRKLRSAYGSREEDTKDLSADFNLGNSNQDKVVDFEELKRKESELRTKEGKKIIIEEDNRESPNKDVNEDATNIEDDKNLEPVTVSDFVITKITQKPNVYGNSNKLSDETNSPGRKIEENEKMDSESRNTNSKKLEKPKSVLSEINEGKDTYTGDTGDVNEEVDSSTVNCAKEEDTKVFRLQENQNGFTENPLDGRDYGEEGNGLDIAVLSKESDESAEGKEKNKDNRSQVDGDQDDQISENWNGEENNDSNVKENIVESNKVHGGNEESIERERSEEPEEINGEDLHQDEESGSQYKEHQGDEVIKNTKEEETYDANGMGNIVDDGVSEGRKVEENFENIVESDKVNGGNEELIEGKRSKELETINGVGLHQVDEGSRSQYLEHQGDEVIRNAKEEETYDAIGMGNIVDDRVSEGRNVEEDIGNIVESDKVNEENEELIEGKRREEPEEINGVGLVQDERGINEGSGSQYKEHQDDRVIENIKEEETYDANGMGNNVDDRVSVGRKVKENIENIVESDKVNGENQKSIEDKRSEESGTANDVGLHQVDEISGSQYKEHQDDEVSKNIKEGETYDASSMDNIVDDGVSVGRKVEENIENIVESDKVNDENEESMQGKRSEEPEEINGVGLLQDEGGINEGSGSQYKKHQDDGVIKVTKEEETYDANGLGNIVDDGVSVGRKVQENIENIVEPDKVNEENEESIEGKRSEESDIANGVGLNQVDERSGSQYNEHQDDEVNKNRREEETYNANGMGNIIDDGVSVGRKIEENIENIVESDKVNEGNEESIEEKRSEESDIANGVGLNQVDERSGSQYKEHQDDEVNKNTREEETCNANGMGNIVDDGVSVGRKVEENIENIVKSDKVNEENEELIEGKRSEESDIGNGVGLNQVDERSESQYKEHQDDELNKNTREEETCNANGMGNIVDDGVSVGRKVEENIENIVESDKVNEGNEESIEGKRSEESEGINDVGLHQDGRGINKGSGSQYKDHLDDEVNKNTKEEETYDANGMGNIVDDGISVGRKVDLGVIENIVESDEVKEENEESIEGKRNEESEKINYVGLLQDEVDQGSRSQYKEHQDTYDENGLGYIVDDKVSEGRKGEEGENFVESDKVNVENEESFEGQRSEKSEQIHQIEEERRSQFKEHQDDEVVNNAKDSIDMGNIVEGENGDHNELIGRSKHTEHEESDSNINDNLIELRRRSKDREEFMRNVNTDMDFQNTEDTTNNYRIRNKRQIGFEDTEKLNELGESDTSNTTGGDVVGRTIQTDNHKENEECHEELKKENLNSGDSLKAKEKQVAEGSSDEIIEGEADQIKNFNDFTKSNRASPKIRFLDEESSKFEQDVRKANDEVFENEEPFRKSEEVEELKVNTDNLKTEISAKHINNEGDENSKHFVETGEREGEAYQSDDKRTAQQDSNGAENSKGTRLSSGSGNTFDVESSQSEDKESGDDLNGKEGTVAEAKEAKGNSPNSGDEDKSNSTILLNKEVEDDKSIIEAKTNQVEAKDFFQSPNIVHTGVDEYINSLLEGPAGSTGEAEVAEPFYLHEPNQTPNNPISSMIRMQSNLQKLEQQSLKAAPMEESVTPDLQSEIQKYSSAYEEMATGLQHSSEFHDTLIPNGTVKTPSAGLQHSSEMHDSIPLSFAQAVNFQTASPLPGLQSFSPANIQVFVQDQPVSRMSATPSPILIRSGELTEGSMAHVPGQVYVIIVSSTVHHARAAPVTDAHAGGSQQQAAQQQDPVGSRQPPPPVPGMEAKRNNATIASERNMESAAATKIQASFRGYQVRKQLKTKNGSEAANPRRAARRKSSGKLVDTGKLKVKKSTDELEERSATKIQAGIRGFLVRRRHQKGKKDDN